MLGATFSLQSTLSVSADSVAIRGARYAVSNAIPIVGGTVSGALGLVAGGIQYARGVVGAGAIAVVLSLILAPLVTLISYRLCLKLGVELCSCCSLDVCANLLTSFFGALDVLIATYSLTAVIYIVELLSFLKGGVGIA
jgi:stage III sporulation protein AE